MFALSHTEHAPYLSLCASFNFFFFSRSLSLARSLSLSTCACAHVSLARARAPQAKSTNQTKKKKKNGLRENTGGAQCTRQKSGTDRKHAFPPLTCIHKSQNQNTQGEERVFLPSFPPSLSLSYERKRKKEITTQQTGCRSERTPLYFFSFLFSLSLPSAAIPTTIVLYSTPIPLALSPSPSTYAQRAGR